LQDNAQLLFSEVGYFVSSIGCVASSSVGWHALDGQMSFFSVPLAAKARLIAR